MGLSLAKITNTTKATSSGMIARPMTLVQPKARARDGANRDARTVPELPAPAMPRARPWCSLEYQAEAMGRATAKEAPATPSTVASIRIWPKLCTPRRQAANMPPMTISWLTMPVFFGPKRSTNRPLTTRRTAPARDGVATIRPFWAAFRCRSWPISTASGPSSTQTMKLMSK